MPFPLAHPAVVLPLRRFQWLSLSAMMLGCLTPDVSYCFKSIGLSRMAHSALGSVLFCLPAGLVAYSLFHTIRQPLAAALPSPHRQVLIPLCHRKSHSWFAIGFSVWIGASSHILLDKLTHESQLLVPHLVGLQNEIAAIEREGVRFSRLLWATLSAVGLTALLFAYSCLIRERTGRWSWFDPKDTRRYAIWLGALLLPLIAIALATENPVRHWPWRYRVQHFVYDTMALYLVVMSLLIIMVGLGLRWREQLAMRRADPK